MTGSDLVGVGLYNLYQSSYGAGACSACDSHVSLLQATGSRQEIHNFLENQKPGLITSSIHRLNEIMSRSLLNQELVKCV